MRNSAWILHAARASGIGHDLVVIIDVGSVGAVIDLGVNRRSDHRRHTRRPTRRKHRRTTRGRTDRTLSGEIERIPSGLDCYILRTLGALVALTALTLVRSEAMQNRLHIGKSNRSHGDGALGDKAHLVGRGWG